METIVKTIGTIGNVVESVSHGIEHRFEDVVEDVAHEIEREMEVLENYVFGEKYSHHKSIHSQLYPDNSVASNSVASNSVAYIIHPSIDSDRVSGKCVGCDPPTGEINTLFTFEEFQAIYDVDFTILVPNCQGYLIAEFEPIPPPSPSNPNPSPPLKRKLKKITVRW